MRKLSSIKNRLNGVVKWTALVVMIVLSLDLLIIIGFSFSRLPSSRVDAVIVLGAKVGTPALTERTLQGLRYYQQGKTGTIVLSGGRGLGESIAEAEAMQAVIAGRVAQTGGKMPNVILESTSVNTFQNIHNTKALIPNAKSIVIISDSFHLARSAILAKRDGFPEVYWDAPVPSYYSSSDLVFYYLREVVGMIAYIPKFLTN